MRWVSRDPLAYVQADGPLLLVAVLDATQRWARLKPWMAAFREGARCSGAAYRRASQWDNGDLQIECTLKSVTAPCICGVPADKAGRSGHGDCPSRQGTRYGKAYSGFTLPGMRIAVLRDLLQAVNGGPVQQLWGCMCSHTRVMLSVAFPQSMPMARWLGVSHCRLASPLCHSASA